MSRVGLVHGVQRKVSTRPCSLQPSLGKQFFFRSQVFAKLPRHIIGMPHQLMACAQGAYGALFQQASHYSKKRN